MLTRLAATYFEQGKFEECIQTYRRLIAENPQGKDAPIYQNSIIEAYTKIGRREETLSELERLRTTYRESSAWARDNSADHEAVKSATDYIEKNLRTAATNFHNDAKKMGTGKGAIENYALAYKAYSVYLQEFPEGKYTYDVRYAFGELLYRIKKFDDAWDQYMKVVALDPNGQHSKFCADSAVYAAVQVEKRAAESGDSAAVALWKQRHAEACATSISLGGRACLTAPEKATYGASDNK
jgi:tetratricopeptide (TPR) repeat protein